MDHIEAVLICDGSSDAALEHPIRWLLAKAGYKGTLSIQIADYSRTNPPIRQLSEKIQVACKRYKPDVLFIHRDSEREPFNRRLEEVQTALKNASRNQIDSIPVIPVRMLEAWLLFDEKAIRRAAGNPNGSEPILLPKLSRVESEPDPKRILCQALSQASGLSGRRLHRFRPLSKRHLVAEEIEDFSPLLHLTSFSNVKNWVSSFLEQDTTSS